MLSEGVASFLIFLACHLPPMKADEWFRAAEENLHAHFLSLAHGATSRSLVQPCLELFAFGGADIPEFNLAFLKPREGFVLDEALHDSQEFFSTLGRTYMMNAPGLEQELLRRGWWEEDPFQAMHLDLTRLPRGGEMPQGVEIGPVRDREGMDALSSTLCRSWGIAPRHWDGVSEMLRSIDIGPHGAFRGYVLYVDRSPASSLLILEQGNIAGVQLVSTLPSQRGKGWAQRLLIEALQVARDEGATDSVLEATKMGARSYERIGFEGCGWSRYLSPPHQRTP